jgi:hypothetical protein
MTHAWNALHRFVLVTFFAILSACSVALVPDYDPEIADGLNALNLRTLTLMSAVEGGAAAQGFGTRRAEYDAIIGGFDALRLRAEARDVPPLGPALLRRLEGLGFTPGLCRDEGAVDCVNPTPKILANVTEGLRKMRDTDAARGLDPGLVQLFRNGYETSILQALTVETALER